jgi:peptide/nickel transport system substrate-binding protein
MKSKRSSTKLLLVSLVLCSVLSFTQAIAAGPQYGGTLKIGLGDAGKIFGYPQTVSTAIELMVAGTAIENLFKFDETGTPIPWLATGWEVGPDLKSITLTLRKDVKFHDGTDFNAQAVKWNLTQFSSGSANDPITRVRAELSAVSSIDVLDDYKVRLNLSRWDNTLVSNLAYAAGGMISPTAFQKNGQAWCENNPVGTGPFQFVSWQKDVSVTFKKFEGYWQKGKPYLEGVQWVIIADPMTQLAAFMKGDIDVLLDVAPKNVGTLQSKGKYQFSSVRTEVLAMIGDSVHSDSPFADVRVRQAVNYAIDTNTIVKVLTYGLYTVVNQYSFPGSWANNPDVKGYPYNPAKAKELLAAAGYPNGFKTTIYVRQPPAIFADTATAIQGYLKAVDIDAQVQILNFGGWAKMIRGGWQNGLHISDLDVSNRDDLLNINRTLSKKGGLLTAMDHPDDYEKAIDDALLTSDLESKKRATREVNRLMVDKYAMVSWIYGMRDTAATQPKVHDTGLYTISQNQSTLADAWIER